MIWRCAWFFICITVGASSSATVYGHHYHGAARPCGWPACPAGKPGWLDVSAACNMKVFHCKSNQLTIISDVCPNYPWGLLASSISVNPWLVEWKQWKTNVRVTVTCGLTSLSSARNWVLCKHLPFTNSCQLCNVPSYYAHETVPCGFWNNRALLSKLCSHFTHWDTA